MPSEIFLTMNAGYAQAMYEQYLRDPGSVDEAWRQLFENGERGLPVAAPSLDDVIAVVTAEAEQDVAGRAVTVEGEPPPAPAVPDLLAVALEDLMAVAQAASVVKAFRTHGHLGARLDPLGSAPVGDPAYDPASIGLTEGAMRRVPSSVLRVAVPGRTFADALPHLRATYCGTIAYEKEHIGSHEERVWLRRMIESGAHLSTLSAEEKTRLLVRLTEVEALERFLARAYLGQKRFSIEGVDMLVPMLDLTIELAAEAGARQFVIGMAHRGRLNVLAHLVGMPYEEIVAEFEGGPHVDEGEVAHAAAGDVKYHLGNEGAYETARGRAVRVTLSPNPSHLEAVNPVVEGHARAIQTERRGRAAIHHVRAALPVLIHGDAAYAGQGVVAETLNLARLAGYSTGGTIHIITNNQVGFTTDPKEARSTDYASDLAKGFDHPIIHVNADDPEACLAAVRLAMAYRDKFHGDVIIDLVGYRRHGHNEADEPAYTQPVMFETIARHPTARAQWADKLVREGVITAADAEAELKAALQRLAAAQQAVRAERTDAQTHGRTDGGGDTRTSRPGETEQAAGSGTRAQEGRDDVETGVPADVLRALNERLLTWPEGFTVHPKLLRQLERRREALGIAGGIDWGHAEALALASLVLEGTPVRLTGQDTERGTFSQRHLVLHDAKTGERYAPIQRLSGARASFELHNSPLSEFAALGFEYGYSAEAPEALVIWEAQFGDFANGAQVVVDQFVSAGLAKWDERSRLVLLLPHGYEGQGPEHSSARPERFLQLAAEDNIQVANCTTPAQYFHLLRRQARLTDPRPLVVLTPKSLLRHPLAGSSLEDLASGRFRPVLDDPAAQGRRPEIERLVLLSGKVYYDLFGSEARPRAARTALIRVEQLFPLPEAELRAVLAAYPARRQILWVQEEPQNMGAWTYLATHLAGIVPELGYIGRPERAAVAEGYPAAHQAEQARIVREAFGMKGGTT